MPIPGAPDEFDGSGDSFDGGGSDGGSGGTTDSGDPGSGVLSPGDLQNIGGGGSGGDGGGTGGGGGGGGTTDSGDPGSGVLSPGDLEGIGGSGSGGGGTTDADSDGGGGGGGGGTTDPTQVSPEDRQGSGVPADFDGGGGGADTTEPTPQPDQQLDAEPVDPSQLTPSQQTRLTQAEQQQREQFAERIEQQTGADVQPFQLETETVRRGGDVFIRTRPTADVRADVAAEQARRQLAFADVGAPSGGALSPGYLSRLEQAEADIQRGEDFRVDVTETGVDVEPTEQFRIEQAAEETPGVSADELEVTEAGQVQVTEEARQAAAERRAQQQLGQPDFQLGDELEVATEAERQARADVLQQLPGVGEFIPEPEGSRVRLTSEGRQQIEQQAISQLEQDLEAQYGVNLDREDIAVREEGGQYFGTLSTEGEETVAVQTAPFRDVPVIGGLTTTGARLRQAELQATDPFAETFREETPDQAEAAGFVEEVLQPVIGPPGQLERDIRQTAEVAAQPVIGPPGEVEKAARDVVAPAVDPVTRALAVGAVPAALATGTAVEAAERAAGPPGPTERALGGFVTEAARPVTGAPGETEQAIRDAVLGPPGEAERALGGFVTEAARPVTGPPGETERAISEAVLGPPGEVERRVGGALSTGAQRILGPPGRVERGVRTATLGPPGELEREIGRVASDVYETVAGPPGELERDVRETAAEEIGGALPAAVPVAGVTGVGTGTGLAAGIGAGTAAAGGAAAGAIAGTAGIAAGFATGGVEETRVRADTAEPDRPFAIDELTPGEPIQERDELTPGEPGVGVDELAPETPIQAVDELAPGEPRTTELDVPEGPPGAVDAGPTTIQTTPVTAGQLVEEEEQIEEPEETQPEIGPEDILGELPEPDQPGPSVREQQRREDLLAPERQFVTGEEAVVGRGAERVREAQEPAVFEDTEPALDVGQDVAARQRVDPLAMLGQQPRQRARTATMQQQQQQQAQTQRLAQPQAFDFLQQRYPEVPEFGTPTETVPEQAETRFGYPAIPGPTTEPRGRRPSLPELEGDETEREGRFLGAQEEVLTAFVDPLTGDVLEARADGF